MFRDYERILASSNREECEKLLKEMRYRRVPKNYNMPGYAHLLPVHPAEYTSYDGTGDKAFLTDKEIRLWCSIGSNRSGTHLFNQSRIKLAIEIDRRYKNQVVNQDEDGNDIYTDHFEEGISTERFVRYCDLHELDKIRDGILRRAQANPNIVGIRHLAVVFINPKTGKKHGTA